MEPADGPMAGPPRRLRRRHGSSPCSGSLPAGTVRTCNVQTLNRWSWRASPRLHGLECASPLTCRWPPCPNPPAAPPPVGQTCVQVAADHNAGAITTPGLAAANGKCWCAPVEQHMRVAAALRCGGGRRQGMSRAWLRDSETNTHEFVPET